jgi:PAS domain S-box-containing protein
MNSRTDKDQPAADPMAALHRRAEALAREKSVLSPERVQALSAEAMQQTLHQLQVHQIELEMQNEELRATQLQLDTARARYFDLYDLAPVGYCTINEHGLILEANIMAASLLGMTRHELVGKRVSRFIVRTHQDRFYLQRKQLIDTGLPQSCELQMIKPDGAVFWAHLAATIEKQIDGHAVLRMVMSDITERKQSEELIRKSEERYRNLFNSIDEGFCVIEVIFDAQRKPVDFRYVEVNPAFEKQTGLHEVTGKRILELDPDFEVSWFQIYGNVVLTGEPVRVTNGMKTINRWFDVYAFRIGGPHSNKVAVIFNNITARMLAESERAQLDQALQDKNTDLERATLLAEKANRAKSEFLSNMSHELRTPLHAILGFTQLIESGSPPPTPSQKSSIEQILRAGWYLLDLINEILDLAVVESGKLSLSLEAVSLKEVMLECQAMIEPQAHSRSISVTFPHFDIPYCVRADRTRIKQVFVNLLSNAIKYNKTGGTVQIVCNSDTPGRVRICVEDSGAGLPAEKLAQLFQPFNRLGQEATNEEGTGIGLVVCKRLTEMMGGSIGAESTVGKGSTFWVELSLLAQPVADVHTIEPATAPVQLSDAHVYTLLYVEDNPANLKLVVDLIARRPDIRLLSTSEGSLGVEMARTAQPDVILMDVNLPGINGVQALKLLAEDSLTAHIPVIALSAYAMPGDIAKGIEAGFFRYLTKPIKINEFMNTLDMALQFSVTELTS